jgi:hypothetical protein
MNHRWCILDRPAIPDWDRPGYLASRLSEKRNSEMRKAHFWPSLQAALC